MVKYEVHYITRTGTSYLDGEARRGRGRQRPAVAEGKSNGAVFS